MRMIDADAAIDAFDNQTWERLDIPICKEIRNAAKETIRRLPTIDAVPVVRCKDCKYYQQVRNADDWLWCMMNHHYTDEEKYCAWAERKEE